MAWAFGMFFGPLMSSFILDWMGYAGTLYFISGFIAVVGLPASICCIPKRINESKQDPNDKNPVTVSYCQFISNYRVLTMFIAGFLIITPLLWIDALLAPRLIKLGMTEAQAGLGFSLNCFFYGCGAPLSAWLCTKIDRRLVLLVTYVMTLVACFLCGPS